MKKIKANRIKFYAFLNEEIEVDELEEWIYKREELKDEFTEDHYFDLISFPYKSGDTKSYITKLVCSFFDYQEYELWRTIKLLKEIVEGKIETVMASRKLEKLYREQEEKLESPLITIKLGVGYESLLEECPIEEEYKLWSKNGLEKQLKTVKYYKDSLVENALIELRGLQSMEAE